MDSDGRRSSGSPTENRAECSGASEPNAVPDSWTVRRGAESKLPTRTPNGKRPKRKYMPFKSCCADGKYEQAASDRPHARGGGSLNPLIAKEPEGINAVGDEEWVKVEVAVDSGATETVMDERTLAGVIDITESPAMKRGVTYEVADGATIPNLGERKFLGVSEEGVARGMTAQVCAVNKTLMRVSKLVNKGNRVVFEEEGSYIEDKTTGEVTWMRQAGGMYYLDLWVSRRSSADAGF